jgi:carbon monoxide dehydrogenase subunit G
VKNVIIKNSLIINANRGKVASILKDVRNFSDCIPNVISSRTEGSKFSGKVRFKIGSVSGTFDVDGEILEKEPERAYDFYIKSGTSGNIIETKGTITLSDADNGKTLLEYHAEAKLGGMIAALGKIIESTSNDLIKQMFSCIEQKISK